MSLPGPPVLCLVTPTLTGPPGPLLDLVSRAAAAGVHLIQIRQHHLGDRILLDLVEQAIAAARGTPARVLVNDRLDIALAAGAHGVHLRATSFGAADVRRLAPREFLTGRSIHSAAEAVAAVAEGGSDYLVFGTVFPSRSKTDAHPTAGIKGLMQACQAAQDEGARRRVRCPPILGIGGISEDRAGEIARAGAGGIAGIELFGTTPDLARLVRAVAQAFDTPPGVV